MNLFAEIKTLVLENLTVLVTEGVLSLAFDRSLRPHRRPAALRQPCRVYARPKAS